MANAPYQSELSGALLYLPEHSPIFCAEGPDAERYLHGRLTQDLRSLPAGKAAASLLLTPQGKIQGECLLVKLEERILIIPSPLPSQTAESDFLIALLQYKVADQLSISAQNSSARLILAGNHSAELLEGFGSITAVPGFVSILTIAGCDCITIANPLVQHSNGSELFDLIVNQEQLDKVIGALAAEGAVVGVNEHWECVRISLGLPRFGVDISEKTAAPDIDLSRRVSFNKGCYTGQEVVEMSTARGRPNRKFCGFITDAPVNSGSPIELEKDSTRSTVGEVTSSFTATDSGRTLALGFVKYQLSLEDSTLSAAGTRLIPRSIDQK